MKDVETIIKKIDGLQNKNVYYIEFSKMTLEEFLLICNIFGLLQVFDGSNGMTLLDALTRAVVTPEHDQNVRLYVAALTLLSLRDDFSEFLKRPVMTFFHQSFAMMKIKLISQRRSQIVIRSSGEMKTSSTEHPLLCIARICNPAIRDALIPAGARLLSGCYLTAPNLSSDGSFWADMCPHHGCWGRCGKFDHMDKNWGQFPNLGRGMWESIITEVSKEFFFIFCSEYAKFVCWVLENPFIFANRWVGRSNPLQRGSEFEMGIPFLPEIFENEVYVLRTLLPCFVKLPAQNGCCMLVPRPFMMIVDPTKYQPIDDSENMSYFTRYSGFSRRVKPKSKMGAHIGMLTKVAESLDCVGGFADSILRRVLHAPDKGLINEFKDENLILTKKLLRILGHFKNEGLLQVFKGLEELLYM